MRPVWVRYPNGRKVFFDYDTGANPDDEHADKLNRPFAIRDDGNGSAGDRLVEYWYLGLGRIVIEDLQEPEVMLDYETSGSYGGLDAFGRVVQQLWTDYGPEPDEDCDKYTYGYDRAGNRNYRENTSSSGKDEYYTYDGIYRLIEFDRGDLNEQKTGISGTPGREEDFTLDATGNWSGYVQKTSGTTQLNQSRAHNHANEIDVDDDHANPPGDSISATTGTNWYDPSYDAAGNMTGVPKPSSPANGLTCKYDAWNRLAEVKDGTYTVGRYEYDGLGRRIKKGYDSQSPAEPNGIDNYVHYFYDGIQVVETRQTTTENAQPEQIKPKYQYLWSPRYVDAPILRDENTDEDWLCDDDRLYYLTDANFNVTCLIDPAGDAQERYLYDPYGRVTIYDGNWSSPGSTSAENNAILYTGRRLDVETGLYYYRARYYSAELARFVSRDPIGYQAAELNLYCYAVNGPLDRTDPEGLADMLSPPEISWAEIPPPEIPFPLLHSEAPSPPWPGWPEPDELLLPVGSQRPMSFDRPLLLPGGCRPEGAVRVEPSGVQQTVKQVENVTRPCFVKWRCPDGTLVQTNIPGEQGCSRTVTYTFPWDTRYVLKCVGGRWRIIRAMGVLGTGPWPGPMISRTAWRCGECLPAPSPLPPHIIQHA